MDVLFVIYCNTKFYGFKMADKSLIIEIDNITPPSVNTYWRAICRNGFPRFYISKVGSEFKKVVGLVARTKIKEPLKSKVKVEVEYCFRGKIGKDIDNILKAILDSLTGIVYVDDKQIFELSVKKIAGKKNKLIIKVAEIES